MVGLTDVLKFSIENPEWFGLFGWLLVMVYLAFELRHPKGRVYQLDKHIKGAITVIRGLARVHDDVDTKKVDDYLVENGMEPDDFLKNNTQADETQVGFELDSDDGDGGDIIDGRGQD